MADSPIGPALLSGLSDKDIETQAWDDWIAARDARAEIEDRKRQAYRDYRAWRSDASDGGKAEQSTGPFGWSSTTVPMIYWSIETILPRLGTQTPSIIARPQTPQAVAYAQAKSMRIQYDLKHAGADTQIQLALRTGMVMGDGVMKIPFDERVKGPTILAIDWWDAFVSPEATAWKTSEVIFHRSWHTRRDLQRLAERKDPEGRSIYDEDAIEQLIGSLADRSTHDNSYSERREIGGLSSKWSERSSVVPIIECWYREGARVVIAGTDRPLLLSVQKEDEYVWKDPYDRPFRPFAVFTPTPDLFSPYGISLAEMLSSHQRELSVLRNAYTDQISASIFSPLGFDARKVRPEDVAQAWSAPGGMFAVEGPPNDAVARFQPGSMTRDFSVVYEQIRSEAQLIGGTSDYGAGMSAGAGIDNQTATGISLIVSEGNKRYEALRHQHELAMRDVACAFDYIDRRLGPLERHIPLESGYQMPPDAMGVNMTGDLATVGAEVNTPDKLYDVEIDVGAMAPPQNQEQAKNVTALIQSIAMLPPPVQQQVQWDQLMRMLMESLGQNPDRLINPMPPMDPAMAGGEVPLGPPEPIPGG
jgi:hypothetical protein